MDKLLSHPGFRLIYVDDNGNMSLITPLLDGCKEDILENGYRCISHLWGNATIWEDHPVDYVPWKVEVREEKRTQLLRIFNHFKEYWWMDVFCTDQESSNKPLSIMGDVYRNCKECVCMLDIKIPRFINQPRDTWTWNMSRIAFNHVLKLPKCKWSNRVWTLQEWFLPREIFYTTETYEQELTMVNPRLINNLSKIDTILALHIYLYDFSGYLEARSMLRRVKINNEDIFFCVLISQRECKDPRDYYYGIAGMFNVPLIDGLSFDEVEKEFISYVNSGTGSGPFIIKTNNTQENVYEHWKFTGKNAFAINFGVNQVRSERMMGLWMLCTISLLSVWYTSKDTLLHSITTGIGSSCLVATGYTIITCMLSSSVTPQKLRISITP